MGRPATGQTPVRSVRIPDRVWNAAKAHADAEGKNISELIATLLDRYNKTADRKQRSAVQE